MEGLPLSHGLARLGSLERATAHRTAAAAAAAAARASPVPAQITRGLSNAKLTRRLTHALVLPAVYARAKAHITLSANVKSRLGY